MSSATTDRTAQPQGASTAGWGSGGLSGDAARLRRRFPMIADLAEHARRRVPRFAYDFVAGGVGDDRSLARNRAALDDICITPRYGVDASRPDTGVTLFGRHYAMPIGIAPMGLAGLLWPNADEALAAAAQRARIPYVMSTVANSSIETIAGIAPDVFWYQLYNVPADDHAVTFALIERAARAGAHVLVLTLDVPTRSKRPRDVRNGLVVPFRPMPRTVLDVARSPLWALATLRHGQPRFRNFEPYLPPRATTGELASYVYQKMTGPLTWDVVARIRDQWQGPLVLKGILDPADAAQAVSLGADGIMVSNHGGRQFDAAPAAISALPGIAAAIGGRATVCVDGGIASGLDILRGLVCGADAVFAGRAFLMGHGALGPPGADHVARLFLEELRTALAQTGIRQVSDASHRGGAPN